MRLTRGGNYLLDPGSFSCLCPLSCSSSQPFLRPHRLRRSPPSLIREEAGSSCFCFDDIFSLRIRRESSSSPSRPPPLYQFVRSAEGKSRNLLLEISWIIINAYAVAGGIDRPVVLRLFFVSFVSSFRFSRPSSSSLAAIGGSRYVCSEGRQRRRQRRHEIIQSNERRFASNQLASQG